MAGKPQKPSQDRPRVGIRKQIKRLIGSVFRFALCHLDRSTKEEMLSVPVQDGSSHITLVAPSQPHKVEAVREPTSQVVDSCGAVAEHLTPRSGLGSAGVQRGQNSKDFTSKRQGRGLSQSSETTIGSQRYDAGSRTFALIIGIDQYQSPRKPQLQGAVNDAKAMAQLLQSLFGVPSGNICLLCDHDATRSRILAEFKSLITSSNIQRGDAIIIYFAGHGSQARAPEGWNAEGGMVETICPVDEEFQGGDAAIHGIPDRTIAHLVSELSLAKGKNITLIFDCCHSGGIARGDGPKTVYRYAPTVSSLPTLLDEDILLTEQPPEVQKSSNPLSNYVLLAACRPNERARETVSADGKPCGAFSESLFRHLRACGPATTYAELLRSVARDLENYFQHPICEGENRERPLFDGRIVKQNSKLFTVHDNEDGSYRVDVGALHGITLGSLFSIIRSDSQSGLRREVGILEARTVRTGSSLLHAKDDAPFTAPPHCKAAVSLWGSSDNLLDVYAGGMDPAWTEQAPFHTPRYRLATSPSTCTMTIQTTNNNRLSFDYAPRVYQTPIPQLRPPINFTPPALQHTLNHMNDFHFHLNRRNPSVSTRLKGKIGLRLHRTEGDASSDLFNNNHAVVTPGATYTFTLTNESNRDLFPYLFFFDTTECSIQQWYYPLAINMEPPLIRGSHRQPSLLQLGSEGSPFGPFSFSVPDNAGDSIAFLKLFVASGHASMDSLEQGSAFIPTTIPKSPHRLSCRGGRPSRRQGSTDDVWDAYCYTVTIRRDGFADR